MRGINSWYTVKSWFCSPDSEACEFLLRLVHQSQPNSELPFFDEIMFSVVFFLDIIFISNEENQLSLYIFY